VFTGFIKKLTLDFETLKTMFDETVGELITLLPEFGQNLAGDGKYLDSYAKYSKNDGGLDGRGEQDAKYGVKEYKYEDKDG
jgi:hypothetical protein